MTSTPTSTVQLAHTFADELPELTLDWQAAELPAPELLVLNESLARQLGLDPAELRSPEGLGVLTGTRPPPGARPVAQLYAGHQFGSWNPRMGDGRALLLGDLTAPSGARFDLHLKGSGRTPFARGGDGYAAVGPMLREYVLSESMAALGIPTTRALAVVATGAVVRRERALPGAILVRVAAGHLRVGSVEYARATGDVALLRRVADHAIARHHPTAADAAHPYRALFEAVVAAQAQLIAQWMAVGFIHGVMNTDNMTLSGETIDYGPCAFLDAYDPTTWFSSIDELGRYAYGRQPAIAEWDLARLGEAMLPLLGDDPEVSDDLDTAVAWATGALTSFGALYRAARRARYLAKLGLPQAVTADETDPLIEQLLTLLKQGRVDFTGFFRALTAAASGDDAMLSGLGAPEVELQTWLGQWRRVGADSIDAAAMAAVNPVYIPRNHLVQEALDAATAGDLAPFTTLVDVLRDPFVERPGLDRYALPADADFAADFQTFCGT
ncbi:protein adenylyltransferase SelO [Nakamurella sp. A5-74]|uniref:Protein nucleotidyltransferase YdiU n=1 Tax=Nakamurella sp. A5-74 TaxID=3158264 RepID=A0AAU8DQ79_9ACTN